MSLKFFSFVEIKVLVQEKKQQVKVHLILLL